MKKHIIVALLAATAAFASTLAQAATININQGFDLSYPDISNGTVFNLNSDNFADTLIQVGDTVNLNFNFLPGQALRVTNHGGTQTFDLGLWKSNNTGGQYGVSNIAFNLVGAGGGSFPGNINLAAQSSSGTNVGAVLTGSYLGNNSSITFTGLHASFNVTALPGNSNNFNAAYFWVKGSDVAVTTPVPEPETYALMGLGLAALALARRKAKAA
jgi:hypothetical protein